MISMLWTNDKYIRVRILACYTKVREIHLLVKVDRLQTVDIHALGHRMMSTARQHHEHDILLGSIVT